MRQRRLRFYLASVYSGRRSWLQCWWSTRHRRHESHPHRRYGSMFFTITGLHAPTLRRAADERWCSAGAQGRFDRHRHVSVQTSFMYWQLRRRGVGFGCHPLHLTHSDGHGDGDDAPSRSKRCGSDAGRAVLWRAVYVNSSGEVWPSAALRPGPRRGAGLACGPGSCGEHGVRRILAALPYRSVLPADGGGEAGGVRTSETTGRRHGCLRRDRNSIPVCRSSSGYAPAIVLKTARFRERVRGEGRGRRRRRRRATSGGGGGRRGPGPPAVGSFPGRTAVMGCDGPPPRGGAGPAVLDICRSTCADLCGARWWPARGDACSRRAGATRASLGRPCTGPGAGGRRRHQPFVCCRLRRGFWAGTCRLTRRVRNNAVHVLGARTPWPGLLFWSVVLDPGPRRRFGWGRRAGCVRRHADQHLVGRRPHLSTTPLYAAYRPPGSGAAAGKRAAPLATSSWPA